MLIERAVTDPSISNLTEIKNACQNRNVLQASPSEEVERLIKMGLPSAQQHHIRTFLILLPHKPLLTAIHGEGIHPIVSTLWVKLVLLLSIAVCLIKSNADQFLDQVNGMGLFPGSSPFIGTDFRQQTLKNSLGLGVFNSSFEQFLVYNAEEKQIKINIRSRSSNSKY